MRRTHYLGLVTAFAITQGALIYGCTADAGAPVDDVPDTSPAPVAEAGFGDENVIVDVDADIDSGFDAGGGKDTGVVDANKLDARVRPDTGAPGSPCTPAGAPEQQPCGKCGMQSRVCLGGANDAGATWSDWGACTGEAAGPDTCDPNTPDGGTEACGNCGTRIRLCQPDCHLAAGIVCTGEPPNACHPGDSTFTLALGCPANQGRTATCQANCQLGAPSDCVTPPPNLNSMTISASLAGVVTKKFTAPATPKLARVTSGSCPATGTSTATSYLYVEVKNPTTKTATISVWHTAITGGLTSDTVMTAYASPTPPADSDLAARKACMPSAEVNDSCFSSVPTACTLSAAGLMIDDGNTVTIPAGGSITIYLAAYSATSSGDFNLNTRTESLN